MTDWLYEADALVKCYGRGGAAVTAIREVSFRLEEGELFAITGPSGSGKSTLLGMLGLLSRPTSGELKFLGRRVAELARRATRYGWGAAQPRLGADCERPGAGG